MIKHHANREQTLVFGISASVHKTACCYVTRIIEIRLYTNFTDDVLAKKCR